MLTEELNIFVRYFLADLSTEVVSDSSLNMIIQSMLDSGVAEDDCQEKYYAIEQTLLWLERKDNVSNASNSGGGSVKSRTEKVGNVSVTEAYETGEWASDSGWVSLLNDLVEDPSIIGCVPFEVNVGGGVIIGGADEDAYMNPYISKARRSKASFKSKCFSPWRPYDPRDIKRK